MANLLVQIQIHNRFA